MRSGISWFKIGFKFGILWTRWWTFRFQKTGNFLRSCVTINFRGKISQLVVHLSFVVKWTLMELQGHEKYLRNEKRSKQTFNVLELILMWCRKIFFLHNLKNVLPFRSKVVGTMKWICALRVLCLCSGSTFCSHVCSFIKLHIFFSFSRATVVEL